MLSVSGISKSYGTRVLFSGVSFNVGMSDRVAVIGPNGTGKTTLFDIIAGETSADSGIVSSSRDTTIGYLKQDILPDARGTLIEMVVRASDFMNRLSHKLSLLQEEIAGEEDEETVASLLEELGEVQQQFELRVGYDADHEAGVILSGLGFLESDFHRPLREFSGGWQTRAALARLLFLNPDILILDEPTNHLDLETQRWFENYLKHYHGAVLLTSHDRAFLNNVARKIIAMERDDLIFYRGDYDSYILAREKDAETRQATARRQQRNIDREMRFIERFRYKATKAAQVQSRLKKLEKIERVVVPRATRKIKFSFPEPPRSGNSVIKLEHVAKSYGKNVVYRDLNLELLKGDKVALVGMNGAGKTTLLKILAGELAFEDGLRTLGHNVTTSYFAQYYIESLDPRHTLLEEIASVAVDAPEQQVRGLLGAFLFSGDDVEKKIEVLSGGEKTRLAIARMLTAPANFILMDEPTNHLDIPSREILTDALQDYRGTLCFITHDRTLIREVATRIIEVRRGNIYIFNGPYDEYLRQAEETVTELPESLRAVRRAAPAGTGQKQRQKQRKALEGELRNRHFREISPVNQRIKDVEKEVETAGKRLREIESLMADPEHYRDSEAVVGTNREYKELKERVQKLTGEWDALVLEAERLKEEYRNACEQLDNA